jgi:hypothetical protein
MNKKKLKKEEMISRTQAKRPRSILKRRRMLNKWG